ncbi:hypothetical protein QFZ68_000199 [Streptomyces sp. V1I6]|nr:hypothetical protein [Streptomyces sp. V1I6]
MLWASPDGPGVLVHHTCMWEGGAGSISFLRRLRLRPTPLMLQRQ